MDNQRIQYCQTAWLDTIVMVMVLCMNLASYHLKLFFNCANVATGLLNNAFWFSLAAESVFFLVQSAVAFLFFLLNVVFVLKGRPPCSIFLKCYLIFIWSH